MKIVLEIDTDKPNDVNKALNILSNLETDFMPQEDFSGYNESDEEGLAENERILE